MRGGRGEGGREGRPVYCLTRTEIEIIMFTVDFRCV